MKKRIVMFLAATMAAMCASADPTVTDVVAKQRYPWNGLVDITCKVSGISGTEKWKFALAAVMPDSGNVRKVSQFWVVKNGENSTDKKVQANGTYKLLWDAQEDLGSVVYDNMVIRVTLVDHDKIQLWEGGPYWADTNIGAENPEDYGYYFWWGGTVGYKRVNNAWVTSNGSSSDFSFDPYYTLTYSKSIATLKSVGWMTEDGVLAPKRDAAHVQWGGSWRIPTKQELSDLNSKCSWAWTTMNGVKGWLVCGTGNYASNSIFLPCAGYGNGDSLYDGEVTSRILHGLYGNYWSSVPSSDYDYHSYACCLCFNSSNHVMSTYGDRNFGFSVRAVQGFTE